MSSVPAVSAPIIIPAREELARIKDPAARLLACVEPATNALIRATALPEVEEIHAQAAGIEKYARTIRLSTEAIGAAQTIARRAEVRMGQLLGPKKPKGRPKGSSANPPSRSQPTTSPEVVVIYDAPEEMSATPDISKQRKAELQTLAEHAPTVEAVLDEKAPNGQATRSAVLDAIKHESLNDTPQAREGERAAKQAGVPKQLLALERAMKVVINLFQDPDISPHDYGPNVLKIERLLPALEEALR